jgi:hypothetical protein
LPSLDLADGWRTRSWQPHCFDRHDPTEIGNPFAHDESGYPPVVWRATLAPQKWPHAIDQHFGPASADVTEIHVTICEIKLDPDWSAWQATHHMA